MPEDHPSILARVRFWFDERNGLKLFAILALDLVVTMLIVSLFLFVLALFGVDIRSGDSGAPSPTVQLTAPPMALDRGVCIRTLHNSGNPEPSEDEIQACLETIAEQLDENRK